MRKFQWPEVLGICVVAFAATICFRGWPDWQVSFVGTAAEWTGALATMLAALIALFFGLRELLTQSRESKVRVSMLGALLKPEATILIRRFRATRDMFKNVKSLDQDDLKTTLFYEHIATFIAAPSLVGTRGFLLELAGLGERRASLIAFAIGSLDTLNETVKLLSTNTGHGHDIDLVHGAIEDAETLMSKIVDALAEAVGYTSSDLVDLDEIRFDVAFVDSERAMKIKAEMRKEQERKNAAFRQRLDAVRSPSRQT